MAEYIPKDQVKHLMWTPDVEKPQPAVPPLPQPEPTPSPIIQGKYTLMETAGTYALGVQALRDSYADGNIPSQLLFTKDDGSNIVRPLTFKEVIQARVEDFNTLHGEDGYERSLADRLQFFDSWIDSCTGVAYKQGTRKMKIVPVCKELVLIDAGFADGHLPIDYDSIREAEIDTSAGKYGELLTRDEVINHPAWLTAVEEDRKLLDEYSKLVFAQLKEQYDQDNAMGFWVRQNTENDELRALFVNYLDDDSDANGSDDLSNGGSFLRVAQGEVPEARRSTE